MSQRPSQTDRHDDDGLIRVGVDPGLYAGQESVGSLGPEDRMDHRARECLGRDPRPGVPELTVSYLTGASGLRFPLT